jgi:two-component system cell cycle sensor histidine kinase PleC
MNSLPHPAHARTERPDGLPVGHLEAAPVPVAILDLTATWDALPAARTGSGAGPDDALPLDSALPAALAGTIRLSDLNARARALLCRAGGPSPAAALRRVLGWRANAALLRAGLTALLRGDTLFEGAGVILSATGERLPVTVSLVPPLGRNDAGAVVVYLTVTGRTPGTDAPPPESDAWFRLVFERAAHGMALLDAQGRWVRVNEALCRMLGYTAAELQALDVAAITHPDDIAHDRQWFESLRARPDRGFSREKRYLRKDGRILWANVTGALISPPDRLETGESIVMGHIHDITARKAAEAALIQSEARFRQSFEHAGHGMALVDLDSTVLSVNRAFCEILGMTAATLRDARLDDLTPEPQRIEELAQRRRMLSDGRDAYELEKQVRSGTGEWVWVQANATLIRDAAKKPLYFIYQIVNTSDHHRALARAHSAESQLLGAIETIRDGLMLFDPDDRLVLVNSCLRENLAELAPFLVPGTAFRDLVHRLVAVGAVVLPEGMTPASWIRWRLDRHHSKVTHAYEARARDGSHFLVREGRAADGSTLILRSDITELKRREEALAEAKKQAEQANRSKSAFLANMSHELLTPLNAVIGFSEVVLKELHGPLGAPIYGDYIRNILTAGQHLLAVLSDILDLSRLESGELRLNEALECPAGMIAACIEAHRDEAAQRSIALKHKTQPDLPWLLCDGSRIRQTLDNLVSNALKFTPRDGTVTVQARIARSGQLVMSVSDTGIGMSRNEIRVALSNFGQIQGVFARTEGGTGLGLPLCRALVEAHDGTLDIISQPGAGVTVMARFPSARLVPATDAAPHSS